MRKPAAGIILMLCAASLQAQIKMQDQYTQLEPIVIEIGVPDIDLAGMDPKSYDVKLSSDAGSTIAYDQCSKLRAYGWGLPGKHRVAALVSYIEDGVVKGYTDTHDYEVTGVGPVTTPPIVEKSLKDLAGDKATNLAVLYQSLRPGTRYESSEEFDYVHAARLKARELADNGAAGAIAARLEAATRVFNGDKLDKALVLIVSDLGAQPTTPVEPGPGPTPVEPVPTDKVTQVTYVYKDRTSVPIHVLNAIDKLRRNKKILASNFEEGSTDSDGDVPDQYKIAVDAATKAGLPAVVSQAGSKVLQVVRDPKTEEQVYGLAP